MKPIILLGVICTLPHFLFAQSEPCCAIIHIDAVKNVVFARDKTSGRLYHFTPDAMDLRAIKKGDDIAVSNNKVTSISGATRTYATLRPDYSEPCCAILSIEPNSAQPCCAVVGVSNNATSQTYNLIIPKDVVGKFKVGVPVLNDSVTGLAIIQTPVEGGDGETATYGFPIPGGSNANDKWIISANTLKGSSGRLLFDNPVGSIWDLYIYNAADDKYVNSYAQVNNKGLVTVTPGQYKITINNVPVHNVPIKKGHDTKLKCGLLNVVSNGVWYLKDDSGKISHTSGAKPTKLLVPIGNYTFELEGQSQSCVVKSGETTEM